jgi:predicted small metal-binding protein
MAKVLECTCGWIGRADSDDQLVALTQQHARQVHNMELTREQVLAMARPV